MTVSAGTRATVMPWLPTLSVAVTHFAVRALPDPVSAIAEQALIELAPSLKSTVPVGALPLTVAVKVTLLPPVDGVSEVASVLLKKNPVALKATKDAVRRVREMTYENAEDYLIRAQEALNWLDASDGRHRGMKQFLDDKTYKPGLGEYDKAK